MDPRILSWTKEPKEKLNEFGAVTGLPLHLLELEPRLRVFGFADEPQLEKEPFGRLKSFQDYKHWIDDLQIKIFMAWSPERIENEWIKRLNFIRNWMETK